MLSAKGIAIRGIRWVVWPLYALVVCSAVSTGSDQQPLRAATIPAANTTHSQFYLARQGKADPPGDLRAAHNSELFYSEDGKPDGATLVQRINEAAREWKSALKVEVSKSTCKQPTDAECRTRSGLKKCFKALEQPDCSATVVNELTIEDRHLTHSFVKDADGREWFVFKLESSAGEKDLGVSSSDLPELGDLHIGRIELMAPNLEASAKLDFGKSSTVKEPQMDAIKIIRTVDVVQGAVPSSSRSKDAINLKSDYVFIAPKSGGGSIKPVNSLKVSMRSNSIPLQPPGAASPAAKKAGSSSGLIGGVAGAAVGGLLLLGGGAYYGITNYSQSSSFQFEFQPGSDGNLSEEEEGDGAEPQGDSSGAREDYVRV